MFNTIAAAALQAIPVVGLIFTAYNHLSPKAINEKMIATEELVNRLERASDPNSTKPETTPAESYAGRYAELINRAQWASQAGWYWRPLLFTFYVFFIVLFTIREAYFFATRGEGFLEAFSPVLRWVLELTVVTLVFYGAIKGIKRLRKFDLVNKEQATLILKSQTND